jgi:hypothetical protein
MSGNSGKLSALVSAAGGAAVVLVAFQQEDPRVRLLSIVTGAVAMFAVAPVGVLVSLGIVLLGGGRLGWLQVGVGPRVYALALGQAYVGLRLLPFAAGFRTRQPVDGGAGPGRRYRAVADIAGPSSVAAALAVLAPGQYRSVVAVGCGLALLSWLLSPRSANGNGA